MNPRKQNRTRHNRPSDGAMISYVHDYVWVQGQECRDEIACRVLKQYHSSNSRLSARREAMVAFGVQAVTKEPRPVLRHGLLESAKDRGRRSS